jgi:hypothetical protein
VAAEPNRIEIDPDSEIGAALQRAAANGEPLRLTMGTITYLLVDAQPDTLLEDDRSRASERRLVDEPDAILSLIGIAGTGEPTDIARHKREYIADAIEQSWRR